MVNRERVPMRRRRFLRSLGLAGGLSAFSVDPVSGSPAVGPAFDEHEIDLDELWDELQDKLIDKLSDFIKNQIKDGKVLIEDVMDSISGDAFDYLDDLVFLIEWVPDISDALSEIEESEDGDGEGGEDGEDSERITMTPGAGVPVDHPDTGSPAATAAASSGFGFSTPDITFDVPELDEVSEELEDRIPSDKIERVKDILDRIDDPEELLEDAADLIVREHILSAVPSMSDFESAFDDGFASMNFDLLDDLDVADSFVPNINVPLGAWPSDEDDFTAVSHARSGRVVPTGAGVGSFGRGSAGSTGLSQYTGDPVKPLKFEDCPLAEGEVVTFPLEFGLGAGAGGQIDDRRSSLWIGVEPHSPNCLYAGVDPETGELLAVDDLVSRRETTNEELSALLEDYRDAIDALERFFDEDEDGQVVVDEHADLTLEELDDTVAATIYVVDELYVELGELGYRMEFDYDFDVVEEIAASLQAAIRRYDEQFESFEPDLPELSPLVEDVVAELDDSLVETDPSELRSRAREFDDQLRQLADPDEGVHLATPRRVLETGTALLDGLYALTYEEGIDDAVAAEADALARELRAFLDEHEHSELQMTRELEELINDDRRLENDGFMEELRQISEELEDEPIQVEVTFLDRLPDVTCGRCCADYDPPDAVDRTVSAIQWVADLVWDVINGLWETIRDLDSWLKEKCPLGDFWYRVISIGVVLLLVLGILYIGLKVGALSAIAGAAKAALTVTRAGIVRLFRNKKIWGRLLRHLLRNTELTCSVA